MPVHPTYPGVYVEELPSASRTVSGVSTSNAAFSDFFAQGPVGQAVQITSFRDFERIYGGLHPQSEASYGLFQYFNNGGQIAWVVRVVDPDTAGTASYPVSVVTPTLGQSYDAAVAAAKDAQTAAKAAADAAKNIQQASADLQANVAANRTQAAADATTAAAQATAKVARSLPDGQPKKDTQAAADAAVQKAGAAAAAAKATQDALKALETATSQQDLNDKTKAAVAAAVTAGGAALEAATAAKAASDAAAIASTPATGAPTKASAAADSAPSKATQAPDAQKAAAQPAADKPKTAAQNAADAAAAAAAVAKTAADDAKAAADAANAALPPATPSATPASGQPAQPDTTGGAKPSGTTTPPAPATDSTAASGKSDTSGAAKPSGTTTPPAPATDSTAASGQPGQPDPSAAAKALADSLDTIAKQTGLAADATRKAADAAESASLELQLAIEQAGAAGGVVATQGQVAAIEAAEAAQNASDAAQRAAAAAKAARDVDPAKAAAARATMEAAANAATAAAAAAAAAADKASDALIAEQAVRDASEPVQLVASAANPGIWGNTLRISISSSANGFDLYVQQVKKISGKLRVIASEIYRQLTLDETSSKYALAVVNDASTLVRLVYRGTRIKGSYPQATETSLADGPTFGVPLTGGADGAVAGADQLYEQYTEALDHLAPNIFNLLCLPGVSNFSDSEARTAITQALTYCLDKRAVFLVDVPARIAQTAQVQDWTAPFRNADAYSGAVYYPRLVMPDPLQEYRPRNVPASGTLAGIYARTDTARGVWKAPAGIAAAIQGADLAVQLTDQDSGTLNPLGINALRSFPVYGSVVWGARTLAGADQIESQWKYVNVRRLADYIEESLFQSLKWVVFEPNAEPTWAQIRLEINSFLAGLFAGGAFQGATPDQAFFVHCDTTTTTQADIDRGVVNIIVGFAPTKPAEFVVLQIEQIAGQTS
jgi:hypothetical protein